MVLLRNYFLDFSLPMKLDKKASNQSSQSSRWCQISLTTNLLRTPTSWPKLSIWIKFRFSNSFLMMLNYLIMQKMHLKANLTHLTFNYWFQDSNSSCLVKSLRCLTAIPLISKPLLLTTNVSLSGKWTTCVTSPNSALYMPQLQKTPRLTGRRLRMKNNSIDVLELRSLNVVPRPSQNLNLWPLRT